MSAQIEALRLAYWLERDGANCQQHINAAAELRRLHQQELANIEWQEKTAWVQKTAKPDELGMHRADVMSRRLGRLKNQRDALLEALKELTGHINERFSGGVWDRARAAIKQAEGENT